MQQQQLPRQRDSGRIPSVQFDGGRPLAASVVAVGIVGKVSAVGGACGSAVPSAEFPVALPCPPPALLNLETKSSGAAGVSQDGSCPTVGSGTQCQWPLFFLVPSAGDHECRPCQILNAGSFFELGEMRSARRLDAWLSPPQRPAAALCCFFPFSLSLVSVCRSHTLSL